MKRDFIYIINNKLHNYNYLKYTIIFYIVIIHSYYALFIYLKNNNNMLIFAYFLLLLLCYSKFNKFSYFICYVYLLFTSYLFSINIFSDVIIEGETGRNAAKETSGQAFLEDEQKLGDKISDRRASAKSKLDDHQENTEPETKEAPSRTYIAKRISQRTLKVTGDFKTPASNKKIDTSINVAIPKTLTIS